MEEVRRVKTTKKKNKSTVLLIVLAVILGISLIATAVYFYTLEEAAPEVETLTETTCACYYIDPAVTSECDPRRGFLFETSTVTSDQVCRAPCATADLSVDLLNSDTAQELYQVCNIPTVQDVRCTEMTIRDSAGRIITGKVSPDDEITIEATFNQEYSNHQFTINNEPFEPDSLSADQLTIQKTYSDLSAPALNIFATAQDATGSQINSPICRRLIETDFVPISEVNEMEIQIRRDGDIYKVSRIRITAGNVTVDEEELTVRFSFDRQLRDLLMNEGFTVDPSKGEIVMIEQDLYDSGNFGTDISFSQLDGLEGDIEIIAEIRTETEVLGVVEETINFPELEEEEGQEETEDVGEEVEASQFTVTKDSNVTCVERVSPNNIVQFTLSASNQGNSNQNISSVKDKLPLGFTYVEGSSRINGVSVSDGDFVTVNQVGDTQEIVWEKSDGWTVDPGQSLTIVFQSEADDNALTGSNQNEVIITPAEIPEDPETLRAELVIEVAQNCEDPQEEIPVEEEPDPEEEVEDPEEEIVPEDPDATTPDTGIFDSVIGRIIIGLFVIVTGWYIYSKPMGQAMIEKLVDSGLYKETEILSWKIFKPKKYFEAKTVKQLDKKKRKKK